MSLFQKVLQKVDLLHLEHPTSNFYGKINQGYVGFVQMRLLSTPLFSHVYLDAVRLRGRHLSWLRHSWIRQKTSHKSANNLCRQWWILFLEITPGMFLMQGNQRFCHFLQQLLTSMLLSFFPSFPLFCWLVYRCFEIQILYVYVLFLPQGRAVLFAILIMNNCMWHSLSPRYKAAMIEDVPRIFEAVFQCTLEVTV